MTRLITPVVDNRDFSPAELSAARLDGELLPFASAFIPIDEPDRPLIRAFSVSSFLGERDVVAGRTAAWIHGASADPVRPYEVCSPVHRRTSPQRTPWLHVREHVVADTDAIVFRSGTASVRVMTPAACIVDIVRSRSTHHFDALFVAAVARIHDVDLDRLAMRFFVASNLPGKRRTLAQLRAAMEWRDRLETR